MPLDNFYLPKESVTLVNYPVLREQRDNIEQILIYVLRVESALVDYNEARYDKVDLNTDEINQYVDLCRTVTYALGTAESVPYDILIELRNIQAQLYSLVYINRQEGTTVFGTPTTTTTTGEVGL
jgi:hypothetical protein